MNHVDAQMINMQRQLNALEARIAIQDQIILNLLKDSHTPQEIKPRVEAVLRDRGLIG